MSADSELDARARASRAMDRYADGDDAAFGELYDVLGPFLFGFAMRLARHRASAEDVVQQTFLLIHRSRQRWIRGARVFPWAFAIAHHFFIDSTRRHRREGLTDAEVPEVADPAPWHASVEDDLDSQRRLEELMREIERLPEKLRLTFQLVGLEGLSIAEAAEVLGLTTVNVKVRVHRAREALKRLRPAVPGVRRSRSPGPAV
jgi:RNA polymerase sigma-70 factor, ECF subfamily